MTASEKTIGIIVCRMTSSRLPGKALREIQGKPLIGYSLERLKQVSGLDEIWLTTTADPSDAPLLAWAQQQGIKAFAYAGEIDDVVGRLSGTIAAANADRFVFVLGDSPFVDSRLIDMFLTALNDHPAWEGVFLEMTPGPTHHCGIACYRRSGWQKIDAASTQPQFREHLGSILSANPDLIVRGFIQDEPLYYGSGYRLSVDTEADLAFARAVYDALQVLGEPLVSFKTVLEYLEKHPELTRINGHVKQRGLNEGSTKALMVVQAGGTYGTGHLARAKTLAKELEERFATGVFYWVENKDAAIEGQLKAEQRNVLLSPDNMVTALGAKAFSVLVVDRQTPIEAGYFDAIRVAYPDLPIVVIDNAGPGAFDADRVIIPNAHSADFSQRARFEGQIVAGVEAVLMGAAFSQLIDSRACDENRERILVTMGGVDPMGLTQIALDALLTLDVNTPVDWVLPPHSPNIEALQALQLPAWITCHNGVQDLRPLMAKSKLAITAFGITVYELALMGIPAIILPHYEWQVDDLKRFCAYGTAILADQKSLKAQLENILASPNQLTAMAQKGPQWVDAEGAQRVAQWIVNTQRTKVAV